MMLEFFQFQYTSNRLFCNCIKLYWYLDEFFLKYGGGVKLTPLPEKKLPSKSPALLRLRRHGRLCLNVFLKYRFSLLIRCLILLLLFIQWGSLSLHKIILFRINLWKIFNIVITTAQLVSKKPEVSFCTGSNPACSVTKMVRISDSAPNWK